MWGGGRGVRGRLSREGMRSLKMMTLTSSAETGLTQPDKLVWAGLFGAGLRRVARTTAPCGWISEVAMSVAPIGHRTWPLLSILTRRRRRRRRRRGLLITNMAISHQCRAALEWTAPPGFEFRNLG